MPGGSDHLPHHRSRDRAPDGHVQVRRQPPLRFYRAEVLRVVAEHAAHVLDEPVHQRGEVHRIPRRPPVVIAAGVDGCAVVADLAIAVTGQGQEHRGAVGLAVLGGEHLAEGPVLDLVLRKVRGILAAPGGANTASLGLSPGRPGGDRATNTRPGDLGIELANQRVIVGHVLAAGLGAIPLDLGLGAQDQPVLLHLMPNSGRCLSAYSCTVWHIPSRA
jgi:hypothetical protein